MTNWIAGHLRPTMKQITKAVIAFGCISGISIASAVKAEENWWPYNVEVWQPACTSGKAACWDLPENGIGARKIIQYTPLEKASKKWNICASFPHLKDSYWLGADYGIIIRKRAVWEYP